MSFKSSSVSFHSGHIEKSLCWIPFLGLVKYASSLEILEASFMGVVNLGRSSVPVSLSKMKVF